MTVGQIILGLIRLESMHCAYEEWPKKESSPESNSVFKVSIITSFFVFSRNELINILGGGTINKQFKLIPLILITKY